MEPHPSAVNHSQTFDRNSGVAPRCLGHANQEKLVSEAFAYFEQKQVGDQSYDFCDDSGVRHSTGMNYWRGADSRFSIANARGGTESWTRSTRRRVCPCCARRIVQARDCLFASAFASPLIPEASAFCGAGFASGSLAPSEPILLYLRLRTGDLVSHSCPFESLVKQPASRGH